MARDATATRPAGEECTHYRVLLRFQAYHVRTVIAPLLEQLAEHLDSGGRISAEQLGAWSDFEGRLNALLADDAPPFPSIDDVRTGAASAMLIDLARVLRDGCPEAISEDDDPAQLLHELFGSIDQVCDMTGASLIYCDILDFLEYTANSMHVFIHAHGAAADEAYANAFSELPPEPGQPTPIPDIHEWYPNCSGFAYPSISDPTQDEWQAHLQTCIDLETANKTLGTPPEDLDDDEICEFLMAGYMSSCASKCACMGGPIIKPPGWCDGDGYCECDAAQFGEQIIDIEGCYDPEEDLGTPAPPCDLDFDVPPPGPFPPLAQSILQSVFTPEDMLITNDFFPDDFNGLDGESYWDYAEERVVDIYVEKCQQAGFLCEDMTAKYGYNWGFDGVIRHDDGSFLLFETKSTKSFCYGENNWGHGKSYIENKLKSTPLLKCGGKACKQGSDLWVTGTVADMCESESSTVSQVGREIADAWRNGKVAFAFAFVSYDDDIETTSLPDDCGKFLYPALPVGSPQWSAD